MSIGPIGFIGSAAASPAAQGAAETERTQQETSSQARRTESDKKAENAAGLGHTEEDQEASDRDADGRRLWEGSPEDAAAEEETAAADEKTPRAKDPSGDRGENLDLSG